MLIEASRGGHANVANLLLRQPRHLSHKQPSPDPTPEVSSTSRMTGAEIRERKTARKNEHSRAIGKDQVCGCLCACTCI